MPQYLAIGVTEEFFWDSCPVDLEPYLEAEKLKQKQIDQLMWQNGLYTMRALSVVLGGIFGGDVKYFESPMIAEIEESNRPLSEAEKEEMTKNFFLKLKIMQNNFNNSNNIKNSDSDSNDLGDI